ncbi:MAG: FKBP-type peptidyl-prolyl cis-trans isomerase [Ignavibacteria bacterium]|nr:FKBP-type peptidyl-prolyl cis-trans isomerase [Ignavibacteria bacterium]
MKNFFKIFFLLVFIASCDSDSVKKDLPKPQKPEDMNSYSIGYDIGKKIAQDSLVINLDYLFLGLYNGIKGDSLFVTQKEVDSTINELRAMMIRKQSQKMQEMEETFEAQKIKNLSEGQAFLDSNKNKPGVITTPSGLQYTIIKEGTGRFPKPTDVVKVHFKGKYIDGNEFDNTYKHEPLKLNLAQVVPGWREALTKMKEGSIWRIVVPPHLGWGERGFPPKIPPNATLIFEFELISIEENAQMPNFQ